MFVIVVPEQPHRHCDFCYLCLVDDVPFMRYRAPDIYIERDDGRPPDLYEAGEWWACIECAVLVEDCNVEKIVDRLMIVMRDRICDHHEDEVRTGVIKLIQAFITLREKSHA